MPEKVFHPVGCEQCRHTGYKGRVGIYEFMPLSLEVKQLIGENGTLNELRQQAKKEGSSNEQISLRSMPLRILVILGCAVAIAIR